MISLVFLLFFFALLLYRLECKGHRCCTGVGAQLFAVEPHQLHQGRPPVGQMTQVEPVLPRYIKSIPTTSAENRDGGSDVDTSHVVLIPALHVILLLAFQP